MKKIIELDIDKVLEYYNYDFETQYKLKDNRLSITYDLGKILNRYIKELIVEIEGCECDFEIIHFTENGLIEIEYEAIK